MARYIDADKFKSHLEKAMEKMHLIGGVKGVDVGAVIAALDRQPTVDVVPRAEVEEIFEEIDNALIENFHADCQMGDCIEDYYDANLRDDIFKLKQKYTECGLYTPLGKTKLCGDCVPMNIAKQQ